ncbi:MAG TPA: zinc ABC transporter substrate-binding protein [Thermoanaerobaculia bacterium]|nr:zinc ABC transporter substrate-binding protein [Thermoanaerobaculia bacterium]
MHRRPQNRPAAAVAAALCLTVAACGGPAGAPSADRPLRVVTTTGMIADSAARIAGEHATVQALMGPGVDPHLFKASESDVRKLTEADLILYNGLHLEGKMADVLVKVARRRPVVAVSESVPEEALREPPEFAGQYDPHIWFDVSLWAQTLEPIADALAELAPQQGDVFRANAAAYGRELGELDAWVTGRIAEVPAARRVLVTAHDAFGYFGRRYAIEVVGLQGISTLAEAGLHDVERVVDLVVERGIKAIFVESSVPGRAIEAVQAAVAQRGRRVAIGGTLFSDAMGPPGTPQGTYPGMVRHNVETIVEALK